MAKRPRRKPLAELAEEPQSADAVPGGSAGKLAATGPQTQRQWQFRSPVRCPRCGCLQTLAGSTQGRIQYRVCTSAVCRHRFVSIGEAI